jgi:hypothetical protein
MGGNAAFLCGWRAPAQHLLNVSRSYLFTVKVMLIGNCGKPMVQTIICTLNTFLIFLKAQTHPGRIYWKEPIFYFNKAAVRLLLYNLPAKHYLASST